MRCGREPALDDDGAGDEASDMGEAAKPTLLRQQ